MRRGGIPVAILALAIVATACGGDDGAAQAPAPTTSSTPTTAADAARLSDHEAGLFVLGRPPDGYRPIVVRLDPDGTRAIHYSNLGCERLSDYDVTVELAEQFVPARRFDVATRNHELADGTEVAVNELWDDGAHYGFEASWRLTDGRFVAVSSFEAFSSEDLFDMLDSVVGVDADEWERLSVALSADGRFDAPGADATELAVSLGRVGEEEMNANFLVPAGFPLGDDDCRRSCVTLSTDTFVSDLHCDPYPLFTPLGEDRLLAGFVSSTVEAVAVRPSEEAVVAEDTPIAATMIDVPAIGGRFYVADLPHDWCAYDATAEGDDGEVGLGQGGVRLDTPEAEGCEFAVAPSVGGVSTSTTVGPADGGE